jgi:hypothetical protein
MTQNGIIDKNGIFGPMNFDGAVGKCILLNNNLLVQRVYDTLYFIDTNLTLICTSNDLEGLNSDYSLQDFSAVPGNKIAGTGKYHPWGAVTQNHWNFLTKDIMKHIEINCPSSIGNDISPDYPPVISVFPTIFSNLIYIKSNNYKERYNISIFSQLGCIIYSGILKDDIELCTSYFDKGLYFVSIGNKNYYKVFKIIKLE